MRVCQLCAVDFTLKNFLLPLIDGMESAGWEVEAVCADGQFVADLRSRGYRIRTIPISRSLNLFHAMRTLIALIQLFRRERYDILHAHTPVAALIGRLAAWVSRVPLVVYTAHGFYFHEGMAPWKYRVFVFLERLGGLNTDLLFTQSAEDAETSISERIVPAERVLTIGNGVDVAQFDPEKVESRDSLRESLGIPKDAYVVGMIGRQVREKGIAEFLQAAQRLAESHTQVWFLLIGERLSSDHAEGVDEVFHEARSVLGERLNAPGLRNDIPAMLAVMDLFCLPSWREGMPRTIVEAMMMAKPVVATNIRGSREEVIDGETGFLVPVRAPDLLADAIERLLVDSDLGVKMGNAGRARALELYDEQHVVALQVERIRQELGLRGWVDDTPL